MYDTTQSCVWHVTCIYRWKRYLTSRKSTCTHSYLWNVISIWGHDSFARAVWQMKEELDEHHKHLHSSIRVRWPIHMGTWLICTCGMAGERGTRWARKTPARRNRACQPANTHHHSTCPPCHSPHVCHFPCSYNNGSPAAAIAGPCYNTLPHTATHCNTLQRTIVMQHTTAPQPQLQVLFAIHCNALQRTATHCTALQQQQPRSRNCMSFLWHTATYCDILQHTTTHCNTLQHASPTAMIARPFCNTLQHTATHCKALQRTAMC